MQELAQNFNRSPHDVLEDGVHALISEWIDINPMLKRLIEGRINTFNSDLVLVETYADSFDHPKVESLFKRQNGELVFVQCVPAEMKDMVLDEEHAFVCELVNDWYHRCNGKERMNNLALINSEADTKIYHFVHEDGREFKGTQYEFVKKYDLDPAEVYAMCREQKAVGT